MSKSLTFSLNIIRRVQTSASGDFEQLLNLVSRIKIDLKIWFDQVMLEMSEKI